MQDFDDLVQNKIEEIDADADLLQAVISKLDRGTRQIIEDAIAAAATEMVLDIQIMRAEAMAECRSDR